ncbi:MAG: SDR family oxidoreductase [Deltaproteobacteria bacterium]|nr:SDR family oxidoreductase [Deltaproteobacteria bacterium]
MSDAKGFHSIFRDDLFAGQVALVTGGGSGIGRCIAHELARLGAKVVITGRKVEALDAVVGEITAAGRTADRRVMNIREDEEVERVVTEIVKDHGGIDLLVNNAGGQFASPAALIRPKGWRAVVDTNLNGTWFVTQAAFKHSMARRGGSVVSIVAEMWNGFPGMAHTGAARAAVVNLTQTLAVEWAAANVRVNAVAPGYVLSSGFKNYPPEIASLAKVAITKNPAGRPGTESEVSAAVVFLLSPAASYINGATLRVDGASSLQKEPMLGTTTTKPTPAWDGFHLPPDLPAAFLPLRPRS